MLERIAAIINSAEKFSTQVIVDVFTEFLRTIFSVVAGIEGWE